MFKVGLAFEMQVVEDLSSVTNEILIDALITEDEVRRAGFDRQIPTGRRLPGGPPGYKG